MLPAPFYRANTRGEASPPPPSQTFFLHPFSTSRAGRLPDEGPKKCAFSLVRAVPLLTRSRSILEV